MDWVSGSLNSSAFQRISTSHRSRARFVAYLCFVVAHVFAVLCASAQTPATVGQFSSVTTWPYKAVHAHLLPTGKVLWWPPFDNGDNPTLWDPQTNANTVIAQAGANIFCSGHAFFPDGRLLVAGGHAGTWLGLPNSYIFNYADNSWTQVPDMNDGRWYPTNTTLPNGDVLVISGTIRAEVTNAEPQVWQQATGSWRNLTAAHLELPFYPYMFVAPIGRAFCAGPGQTTRYLDATGAGGWSLVGDSNYGTRNWGSAVMYDNGKVLLTGGSPCRFYQPDCTVYPTETAETIDLTSTLTPVVTATPTASATATAISTPAAPTNLTATAVSASQINLSWDDNSVNETDFWLYRSDDGEHFHRIATIDANVTTYPDTGLTHSTTYYYRVRAHNSAGNSDYSNIASDTTNP